MKKIFGIVLMVLLLNLGVTYMKPVLAQTHKKVIQTKEEVIPGQNNKAVDDVAKNNELSGSANEIDLYLINEKINEIKALIKTDTFTKKDLDKAQVYLNNFEFALGDVIHKFEKEQAYAQEALAAFGESIDENEPEDEAITEKREKYTAALMTAKNKLLEANLLKTDIARLKEDISEAHSRIFIGHFISEKSAIIVPRTFVRAISDGAVFFWNIAISPIEWYMGLTDDGKSDLYKKGWYVLLIFGLALSFGLFVRRYIIHHWGYRRTEDIPGYGQKVVVAIVTALAYGVIPSLLIGGCLLWEFTNEDLSQSKFGIILATALLYALYITLGRASTRVVFAPWNGRWRLFNVTDQRAERAFKSITLSIILVGICACLINIATDERLAKINMDVSAELMLLLNVGYDAVKAFITILLAFSFFGEIKTKNEVEDEEDDEVENEKFSRRIRIILFASIFALANFAISLFGYPELASFIFNRVFGTILLIGTFVVVRTMILDLLRRNIIFWVRSYRLRKKLLSKVDLLMSLLFTPILLVASVYLMLRIWDVPASFMIYGVKKFIFGFTVGGINISLIAILTGLCVFMVSITLVRIFRRRLSANLLNRIHMDEGIKNSLLSGISFVGFIISVILAVSAMGVDLSNLAVIAGALSVGIGFGLQDIIKNLVSGIIILFERPFKVGDWVILSGEEGKIKQINIRSTELETWTKRSVIIPNATLISSSLVNLTHGDTWQRQSINVGVSYDSDAEKVTKILLECAKANRKVARVPAPMVVFKDFGASSLDFELRFHVADVRVDFMASSEIRYAILKRFREEGIEIPFPQVVVHKAETEAQAEDNAVDEA